ncbi:protein kinase domain-containing protein [Paenibacillus sp. 481]|uniref:protein kinase domain-containing protein n=1 Tax=Paenibacillus sp. 481 TaxID=2835869 RepID=UPI001E2E7A18|nr:protein kinase [Paenibacillus sp. 481]UHA73471.1 serine/threonine-protein kinase [Paenibacillus sp. 481]
MEHKRANTDPPKNTPISKQNTLHNNNTAYKQPFRLETTAWTQHDVLQLQRVIGNVSVRQFMQHSRVPEIQNPYHNLPRQTAVIQRVLDEQRPQLTEKFGAEIAQKLVQTEGNEEMVSKRIQIIEHFLQKHPDRKKTVLEMLTKERDDNEKLAAELYGAPFEDYFGNDRSEDEEKFIPLFDTDELVKDTLALRPYSIKSTLDKSSERMILLAKDDEKKVDVVIKVITKEFMLDDNEEDNSKTRQRTRDEFNIQAEMSEVDIPSLKLIDVAEGKFNIYIIMEYAKGGTLEDRIEKKKPLSSQEKGVLMHNMVRGLSALHEKGYAHRDIKPENIFYAGESGDRPVLGDYGLSESLIQDESQINKMIGNPLYASPEVLRARLKKNSEDETFDFKKADTFMLGLVFYQQLMGKMPYSETKKSLQAQYGAMGADEDELEKQLKELKEIRFEGLKEDEAALLTAMLKYNPNERLNIEDIKNNEHYQSVLKRLSS